MSPWSQSAGTVQGSRGRHDLPAPLTAPGQSCGCSWTLSWPTRWAGWHAGQQGQGPNSHAALEPGLGRGLVCTDTTEQLLAPRAAFWGEAGHLRRSRAGKRVQPVCVPSVAEGHPRPLLERDGPPWLCSLHSTLTFEPLRLLFVQPSQTLTDTKGFPLYFLKLRHAQINHHLHSIHKPHIS